MTDATDPYADVVPDTKDWTWAASEPCPDCGFVPADLDPLRVGDAVRATLPRWRAVLSRPDVRRRPAPSVWSPLEYGAHVRDVFGVFDQRLALMLAVDGAQFANWDQDDAALSGRYDRLDPDRVAVELVDEGLTVAGRFDTVKTTHLDRVGLRSNGSQFTVRSIGRYFVHDVVHHLHDVGA